MPLLTAEPIDGTMPGISRRTCSAVFDARSSMSAADVTVTAPIQAMGGDQDPYVTLGDLYGWNSHSGSVDVTVFDGGHFFLREHQDAVAGLLASCEQPA